MKLKVQIELEDHKAKTWYSDATKLIQKLYGEHWKLFVGLLSATSPRWSVKKNWRMADSLLSAYLERKECPEKFADLLGSLMPAHLINVVRVLQGRAISGPKVSRFQKNLLGDLSVVTIDVWICQAFGIEQNSLTEKLYNRLEKEIQKLAGQAGFRPAEYQAIIWYAIRRMAGRNPKSFVSVHRSIFCETPYFDFMLSE